MENKLLINNLEYKILSSEINFVNSKINSKNGYSLLIAIDIILNDIKGYTSFYIDFFEEKNYKLIENACYKDLPTKLDSKISLLKIFDTNKFYDFIDSYVTLYFGKIDNGKILMNLNIDDEIIKLNYKGNLFIK